MVHFAYGTGLLLATTLIHAACTFLVLAWLHQLEAHHWAERSAFRRSAVLSGVVLGMGVVAYVESALWAIAYVLLGALPDLRDSLYFSLVTFTTLGYGDITLKGEWRTLAAFQAANGIMMFGWTTALIVSVATRMVDLARQSKPH